jgi:hypothetical protein
VATAQEEKQEQEYFAERVKEQNQQEKQTMAEAKHVEPKKAEPANKVGTAEIDPIQIEVTNCPNFRESVQLLITKVADQIRAATDLNEVQAIGARLKERCGTYADGVVANTNYAPPAEVKTEKK